MRNAIRAAVVSAVAAVVAGAGGARLSAHHSFAPFNMTTERVITGTVSKFEWTNPHSFIFVDVPNDKGGVDSWAIEGMSPNYLKRRGWTKDTVKPGDTITVTIHPLKDGKTGGMFMRAMLDGKVLLQTGQPTDQQ
jgi:Family of unknown function (DUF6152)